MRILDVSASAGEIDTGLGVKGTFDSTANQNFLSSAFGAKGTFGGK
jgi:hypothetical protein